MNNNMSMPKNQEGCNKPETFCNHALHALKVKNQKNTMKGFELVDTYLTDLKEENNKYIAKVYLNVSFYDYIEDVKTGKADCIVMDELPAKEIVKENDNLVILDGFLFQDKYGMIVKKGNDELKDKINKVLERMKNDGTIDKLVLEHSK
jgi:polar amino acid transport system substrate-binding protein